MGEASLDGRLLVAAPVLRDPNFERTVVLVLRHSEDGALGVVLNRPTELPLGEVVPDWSDAASDPPVVFSGGPVAPSAAVCLARLRPGAGPDGGFELLHDRLGTLDLDGDPALVAPTLERMRVFAGYAGWGSGQLEAEVESGAWYVVESLPDDAFGSAPNRLWRAVLRRQPGLLRMVANYPVDPTLN